MVDCPTALLLGGVADLKSMILCELFEYLVLNSRAALFDDWVNMKICVLVVFYMLISLND